jgi:hypothetical protein
LAAVVASTGVVAVVGTGVAAAAACTTTQLVPTQREFVVGQGLPGQTLVRGKETLVRVLLSLPDCATSRQSLRITSASLQVLSGTTPVGTGTLVSPTDATAGQLSPWAGGTKPSDPFFVVAPEVMTAATEGSFPLTFRATVAYSGASGTTPVGGTATFSHTATVAKKSNAMRVLVVPMGDAAAVPRSNQFTASGAGAVQRALEAVSRLYPVPCARAGVDQPCVVNDLGATSGGIRYEIDPGMVDVRSIANAYNANGKFCGGGSNFEAIKSELGQFLLSWNTANATKPADRVLGVVDEAISEGVASSGGACVEGMAAPNSLVGWFRASYSSTATQTGGVLGMELAHTMGAVPFARSGGSYHSPNIAADGSAPGRGHNVTARTMLVGPRSAMRYSSDPSLWNDNSTLLEPADQQYLLCQLGGPTTTDCTTSGGLGTTNGVGAGLTTFVMSGTTRGTAATTDIVESFFSADVHQPVPPDPASPDPASEYRLVQLDGSGAIARNNGVRVTFDSSEHHHDGDGDGDGPNGLFSIAFDGFTGAGAVRFYKCASGNTACITNPVAGGTLLYEVVKPSSKPVVESTSVLGAANVRNYTQDPTRDDTNPAGSSSHVAWVAKCASCITGVTTIHVAPIGDRTKVAESGWANDTSKNLAQTDPALRPDGAAMVYVVNGNLYTATINKTSTPPAIGTPKLIYAKGGANPAADTPTYSSDGGTVFFHSTAGGILKVAATGGKASPLVSTPAKEMAPSASPASGDKRVAYAKGNDVWLVDAANPSQTKRVVTNGASPAFLADGRIAFVRGGAIHSVKADGTDVRQLTNGTTDANPYGAGTTLAFDRPAAGGRDVFLATVGGSSSSARVTSPVADRLVGELLLTCPDGTVYPLAVGVSPVSVDGNTAIFDIAYDETLACGGNGTLTFVAIDGWFRSDPTAASKIAVTNTAKPPVAAISNPIEGATIRPSGLLSLSGTGTSAQDGSLSGGRLGWTVSGPGLAPTQVGTGNRLDVAAPSGGWPVGTLTITLTATDSGGRTATDTRHVTVDGVGPQADLDSTPSDPGPSTATFSFTASDATDPASDVTVLCGLDDATLEPCTSPVSFTNLTDGEHTFWLVAFDDNGNQSVTAFGWIVDATGPGTAASTSPALNADGWAATNSLTVTLTADDGGGSGVNRIVYSLTGAQTGGATVPGASATIPITTQGTTTVTFHAVDNVGNVEPDKTLVVGLDSGPPIVEILGDGLYFPGEKLIGCAADAVSGLKPVTVSYSGVGTPAQVTATYTGPAPNNSPCGRGATTWQADLPPIGIYDATAEVTDLAGNRDTDTASVQVSVLA